MLFGVIWCYLVLYAGVIWGYFRVNGVIGGCFGEYSGIIRKVFFVFGGYLGLFGGIKGVK